MLPFAYTNSDVAQLFSPFGKIARVTILRDKQTRKSRGVAFVQFARAEDCAAAVAEMHDTTLEGFQLSCSIVKDNGRSNEFQRKRKYTPATAAPGAVVRCFECGEYGHFSYDCPRNVLGARERPVQKKKLKKKKKKGYDVHERGHYFNDDGVVNMLYVLFTCGGGDPLIHD
jgi:RNA recognition motif-containing protein